MTLQAEFEYDVAFSFNAMDEDIATQINDLLAPRLKTFIYSERQREIAGTDGQESFSAVYGKKARLVVVMFRPEWGQTPWTRIERDAIKNRSLEDGWDFCIFVPTVPKPDMPPWVPKTKLYVGLERWGVKGAAAVIEARATELGSNPRQESVTERAGRFARAKELKEKQYQFEHSDTGVNAAASSYQEFSKRLAAAAEELLAQGVSVKFQESNQYRILSGLSPCNALCEFWPRYTNSLEDIHLRIDIFKGFPRISGFMSLDEARELQSRRYAFRLLRPDHSAWVGIDENDREFTGEQLADHALRMYMDVAERHSAR